MHSEQLEKCGLYYKIQWKACPRPGLLCTYGPELAHQQPLLSSTQPEPYTDLDRMADDPALQLSSALRQNTQLNDLEWLPNHDEGWMELDPSQFRLSSALRQNTQLNDLELLPNHDEGWMKLNPSRLRLFKPLGDHLHFTYDLIPPPSPPDAWDVAGQHSLTPQISQPCFKATPNTGPMLPLVLALMSSVLAFMPLVLALMYI